MSTAQLAQTVRVIRRFQRYADQFSVEKDEGPLRDWLALTEDELEQAHRKSTMHWARRFRKALTAVGTLVGAVMFPVMLSKVLTSPEDYSVVCLVGATGGALTSAIVLAFAGVRATVMDSNLAKASDQPFLCANALEFVGECQEAADFRDAVVASGRELNQLDLDYIRKLGYQQRQRVAEALRLEKQRVTCMQLHGVGDA